mmetsp:Transcript_118176/g.294798  ORF Transcript_118176/g.294798 Transcript_118176/m.294798 type:complete len:358 (-) Transcript_118176:78-1151(-)
MDQAWGSEPGGFSAELNSELSSQPHDALVSQVKDLQRSDPHAKEQWAAYSDNLGGGRRDPARHSAEFLSAFITHLQTGAKINPVSAPDDSSSLLGTIKFMQKKSDGFKAAWAQFCRDFGAGTYDPAKHDAAFLIRFFDHIASGQRGPNSASMGSMAVAQVMSGITGESVPQAIMDSGAGQFDGWGSSRNSSGGWTPSWVDRSSNGGGSIAPPAKRTRYESVANSHTSAVNANVSAGTQEYLVAQVKNFQRLGAQAKEQWSSYADTYLGGVKDPARHDAHTLSEFCAAYDVPAPPLQQTPQQGSMDGDKEALVMRVKVFQKASKDHSELWRQFCGPTCDPARHTAERLTEFLTMYSVP